MKTYTKEELQNILELHLKWINNESYGIKADLREADLRGADLRGADLRKANLREAENIIYAECSFYSHGECGRKLLAIVIENEIKYFCGCFSGSEEELQEYINDGDEKYKESRQFAFDFVTKAIKMKKYE